MGGAAAKLLRCFREPNYLWWVIYSRALRARGAYLRRAHGIMPPPKRVVIQLTAACNRRCDMCNLWGKHGVLHHYRDTELHTPLDQFKRIYGEVCTFADIVELMGGEPLVHPQFQEIMEYCREKPVPLFVETNGVLLKKYADLLSSPPASVLNISLDGPEEVHDRIRGRKGTFRACLEGIEAIRQRRSSDHSPRIHVRCTVNEYNYLLLETTARMLVDVGIDFFVIQHLLFFSPTVHPENERVMKEEFGVDPPSDGYGLPVLPPNIDGSKVVEQLRSLRSAKLPFPVVTNPSYDDETVLEHYQGGEIREPRYRCLAPFTQISIDRQGNVTACPWVYIGNVLEDGVLGVWNNERFRSFRKKMDRIKRIPLCKLCCYPD